MEIYSLPKYRRCDCHTLNLVAHDPRNIKDRQFVKLYGSLESKLKSFWKKQASSAKASVLIKETLDRLFVLLNETRYDLHSFNCSFTIYLIYSLHFKGGTFFFMPWKEWRLFVEEAWFSFAEDFSAEFNVPALRTVEEVFQNLHSCDGSPWHPSRG